jgi:protocatechuate 3,4-dioxygenase beta subunit
MSIPRKLIALALPTLVFASATQSWADPPTAAKQGANRFTPAPGTETEAIKKLIDAAEAALGSGKSTTALLTDPTYLGAHEWPRFRKLIRQAAQGSEATLVTKEEPGTRLVVTGKVVDRSGRALPAALVYVYQTSAKGWYSDRAAHIDAREGDRKHARLFGYLKTDDAGRFELTTIRPAGYPDSDLPAHIHVEITEPGKTTAALVTEIQFDDDPRLTAAWGRRSQQEGFRIARVKKDQDGGARVQVELAFR